jgi:hypothetical protein
MGLLSDVRSGLVEFFTLRHAQRAALALPAERRGQVAAYKRAAEARIRGARDTASAEAAGTLYAAAVTLIAQGEAAARGEDPENVDVEAWLERAAERGKVPDGWDDAKRAFVSKDSLYVDRLPEPKRHALRDAMARRRTCAARASGASRAWRSS